MRVIHILRKPLSEGTVASNTLKHGTGGINIDASRVGAEQVFTHNRGSNRAFPKRPGETSVEESGRKERQDLLDHTPRTGRWPANVILQHLDGCRCEGVKRVKACGGTRTFTGSTAKDRNGQTGAAYGAESRPEGTEHVNYADAEGKETVANWICEPGCPVVRLDEQSGERKTTWVSPTHKNNRNSDFMGALNHPGHQGYNDTGGASRFYKQVGGKKDA